MKKDLIKTVRYPIGIPDRYPRPGQPFSMAVLADLHNAAFGPGNSELLNAIRRVNPAAVLSAGDLVIGRSGDPKWKRAAALLRELARSYPVYCVNGNHESRMDRRPEAYGDAYGRYMRAADLPNVHVLRNEMRMLTVQGVPIALYGLELDGTYYRRGPAPKLPEGELARIFGEPRKDAYCLLLAHHPGFFAAYAAWGADLTLAGHLHGGIVRLPFLGGLIGPSMLPFPRYAHGLYARGEHKMIVSAGLASHTIHIRVNNPPELVVLDFQ